MIPQGQQGAEAGHERKDADVIGVALVGALVLLIVAISFFTARGLLEVIRNRSKAQPSHRAQVQFPQPRLEVHPGADLAASRRADELDLHSYGWIDRKAGVAHIPIERAMQLLVERGLPNTGGGQTRLQLMQARPETNRPDQHPTVSPAPTASPSA